MKFSKNKLHLCAIFALLAAFCLLQFQSIVHTTSHHKFEKSQQQKSQHNNNDCLVCAASLLQSGGNFDAAFSFAFTAMLLSIFALADFYQKRLPFKLTNFSRAPPSFS